MKSGSYSFISKFASYNPPNNDEVYAYIFLGGEADPDTGNEMYDISLLFCCELNNKFRMDKKGKMTEFGLLYDVDLNSITLETY